MSIDFTKPLQNSDLPMRLLCTDAPGKYPVVCITGCSVDKLTNAPEQVTVDVWVNIYDRSPGGHPTKEDALRFAGPKCRATLHIKRSVPVGHVDE